MEQVDGKGYRRSNTEIQRTRLVMAACSGLIRQQLPSIGAQIAIDIRPQGSSDWKVRLFASDSPTGIEAVDRGEADMAIVNPSAVLTLAYRGTGRFQRPMPVRAITVMPQRDCVGLAVRADTGLRYLEEVAEEKYPLRLSLRGERRNHSIHLVLADILEAAGCPIHAIEGWGGRISYDPGLGRLSARTDLPSPLELVSAGERDALFDEAFPEWGTHAVHSGVRFLSLRRSTLDRLTAMGYREHRIEKGHEAAPDEAIDTVDFSGWPVFCHAELPDKVVEALCEGLVAHRTTIPWEGGTGPFPLERLCHDPLEAPLDVPFHPAAERFWQRQGYLS